MAGARIFKVKLIGDSKDAELAFKRLGMTAKEQSSQVTKSMTGINNALKIGGAVLAVRSIANGLSSFTSAAYESQKVTKQTEAIINATGAAAGMSTKRINDLSQSLSQKTAIDDEAIQTGLNLLLTFKQVRNEAGAGNDIFDRAAQATLDLANVFGSVDSAAVQLGKALADPVAGVTALRRSGINFSQTQRDTIKALVDSNNVLEAQKMILSEVESQVGGTAEAGATSADRFRVAWENVQEDLGAVLIPVLEKIATFLQNDVLPIISTFASLVGEQGLGAGIEYLVGAFWRLIGGMGALGKVIQVIIVGFVALKSATLVYTGVMKALQIAAAVGSTSMQAFATSVTAARVAVAAAGAIGAIVTVAASAYMLLAGSKSEVTEATKGLTDALSAEGEAQKDALASAIETNPAFRDQIKFLDSLGISFNELSLYVRTGTNEAELFGKMLEAGLADPSKDTYYAMADLQEVLYGLRQEQIATEEATRILNGQIMASETAANRSAYAFSLLTNEFAAIGAILGINANGSPSGGGIGRAVRDTETPLQKFLKAMYEGAIKTAEAWIDFRDNIKDSVSQMLDLGDAFAKSGNNLKQFLAQLKSQASAIKSFASNLGKLQAQGLSMPAVQQILSMGAIEGSALAEMLLKGGQSAIQQVNQALSGVSAAGMTLGQQLATASVYNTTSNNYYTINVTSNDPDAVVKALRKYQRQNGAIPIRTTGAA